jgi:UDP-perosamine 4-acetyltransferase
VRESFIVGEGGHARVIASMLRAPAQFVTTDPANEDSALTELVAEHADADFYVGIGNNIARRRVAEKLLALGGRLPACIAPNAFIARDAEIAEAVVICLGSQIGSRARIGFACIVNTLSSVDHDCILGDVTQVTAGVTFGGTVVVGTNGFFGIKSAVIPDRTIGDDVVVMAGSLVTRNVPSRMMVGGSPAQIVRCL